ncbi:hypothetical protein [Rubneribacter sp.]
MQSAPIRAAGEEPGRDPRENGLTDPARTDVSDDDAFGELAALSPEEKLAALEEAVARHPLNREVLYKILAYCAEERALEDMERKIASWPEFRGATQNQRRMAETLVRAHGLERKEYDADDAAITPKRMEGLGEDEASDLAASIAYRTTEAGARFVERHRPRARLEELLQLSPDRAPAYLELLAFAAEKPRTYGEVVGLLRGRPVLETAIDGTRLTMQPSVLVDKLERCGALVWDDGWTATEEGRAFLRERKAREDGSE